MNDNGTAKHVAVLLGGWSAEREVSLVSGAAIVRALKERGYRVTAVDVQRDLQGLLEALDPRPDVVFNALHGRGGEDGMIQGVLEFLGIPYTHSGVTSSAVAMDKALTKRVLETYGVRSPRGAVAGREAVLAGAVMPAPYVLKPVNEGSSVGVRIVRAGDNEPIAPDGWIYGPEVLVEEYVPGRDLTVGIMGDRALTVTEIRPREGFYDYAAKYSADKAAAHLVPAPIPAEVAEEAKRVALLAHQALGCSALSRSDFRWDDSRPGIEGLYFLEINTQPGFTPLSLVPEQAAHLGIAFGDVCEFLVESAACHG